MSSTPIYDELAATYLADLTTPEPGEPADDRVPVPATTGAAAPPPPEGLDHL
ncbi:hypothetical protein ACIGNX_18840 [Actinosynnema sp. NPDC053489]|uniref:hypothetical protein n=1 Tax=Actinosynnema sp. NPDC053489 TaxID=3363916 RepID=UPI0037C9D01F